MADVEGPLSALEAADVSDIDAFLLTSGSIATTESSDSSNIDGFLLASGSIATDESPDTSDIDGSIAAYGELDATAADDFVDDNESFFGVVLAAPLPEPDIHDSHLTLPPVPPEIEPTEKKYLDTSRRLVMDEFNRLADSSRRTLDFSEVVAEALETNQIALQSVNNAVSNIILTGGGGGGGIGVGDFAWSYDELICNPVSTDYSDIWYPPGSIRIVEIVASAQVNGDTLSDYLVRLDVGGFLVASFVWDQPSPRGLSGPIDVSADTNSAVRVGIGMDGPNPGTAEGVMILIRYVGAQ